MTVLVTGFGPFGGHVRNASGEIALALGGVLLPVDWARVGAALADLLARPWGAVLLLGLAADRGFVSLERVALNFREARRADNAGSLPEGSEVVPGGPAAYFSTLPLDALHDSLRQEGVPVAFSRDAGGYLCNAAFYLARHALDRRGVPCGFVHLPPTPDLGAPGAPLPYETQLRAVSRMVERLSG